MIFIDSNIPMYAAGKDSSQKEDCLKFLERVAASKLPAYSSAEVLQEILHRYRAIKRLQEGVIVYETFRNLPIRFLEILPSDVDVAKELLLEHHSYLSSRDSLHLAVMQRNKIKEVVTYDQGFLGINGIILKLPHQFL